MPDFVRPGRIRPAGRVEVISNTLWKLEAVGERDYLFAAHEALNAIDPPLALSLSLFIEDEAKGVMRLEALFDSRDRGEQAAAALGLPDLTLGPLPDEDWVALSLRGLKPVSAGRFTVHGGHDLGAIQAGQIPILVEAGQAFGTGHHGTTRGCLAAFSALLDEGWAFQSVLDLGCGAGTLAIAAAKTLPRAAILASDIDPLAVDVTEANAEVNGVAERICAFTAEGFDHVRFRESGAFDLIFANILAGPLRELSTDIAGRLTSGGVTILSGLLDEQRERVETPYREAGLTRLGASSLDGWTTLVLQKP